jgi:hypothetical protein
MYVCMYVCVCVYIYQKHWPFWQGLFSLLRQWMTEIPALSVNTCTLTITEITGQCNNEI